jgi:hypothetical protein
MKQQQSLGHAMHPREWLTPKLASAAASMRFIGSPVIVLVLTWTLLLLLTRGDPTLLLFVAAAVAVVTFEIAVAFVLASFLDRVVAAFSLAALRIFFVSSAARSVLPRLTFGVPTPPPRFA